MGLLKGAQNTIKTFKPKIAIAVYHRADDLYKILLFIKRLNSEYKFYIRHYSFDMLEFVLYCV